MGYNDVFGGGSINPAQRTYLDLTISADVVLQWPIEQQIGGDDVAVDIIDVNATIPGLNVDFSDARQVSTGYTSLITNVGFDDFTVRDSAGGTIITPIGGTAWFIYLTDNSTAAGVWRTFQLGATVSVAAAAALAGAGLKAIMTKLNQTLPPTLIGAGQSPLNMTDADRAQLNIWNGGVGTFNLPDPVTVGSDWFTYIRNGGTGVLTISTPIGLIDGNINLILNPGVSGIFITDGSDWFTVGLTSALDTGFDFIEVNVAGGGDFVLSGVQLDRVAYRFIGALTANRKIIVPSTIQEYWVDNNTTGAFALEVATATQVTPVGIPQGNRVILYCDGTNVLDAESSVITFPITIAQGGTGAISAPGARTNLGVPPNTRAIIAGEGLDGTGTLAADITFNVALLGLTIAVPDAADFLVFQDIDDSDLSRKATVADVVAAAGGGVPDLETVTFAGKFTTQGIDIQLGAALTVQSGFPSTGLLTIDATEPAPVNIVSNVAMEVVAVNSLQLKIDAAGFISFEVGANNALTIQDKIVRVNTDSSGFFQIRDDIGNNINAFVGTNGISWTPNSANDWSWAFHDGIEIRIEEKSAALSNVANFGSLWVRDDVPNNLIFTDDVGTDFVLNGGGGGGGAYRGTKVYRNTTGNWPLNNTPNFSLAVPGLGGGNDEAAVIFGVILHDTEGGAVWSIAQRTRFNVPPGVTKAIIRTGYGIQGNTSGGYRHMRIRRNGGYLPTDPVQVGPSGYLYQNTNSAAGSGSWWGTQFNTGVLNVNAGDYFEVYVLRQNSSGFTVFGSIWLELEIIA
jgi:hypothetical protein